MEDTTDLSWAGYVARCKEQGQEREHFVSVLLYARQLVLDLATGTAPAVEKRHEGLTESYDRLEAALNIGLVILVTELEARMAQAMRALWQQRRDLLTDWLADQKSHLAQNAMVLLPESAEDSKHGGQRRVTFGVPIKDTWLPTTRRIAIEDYVRDRVYCTGPA